MMFWLARSLLLSLLIGLAAYCVEAALRGRSGRTRWVWAVALVTSSLMPLTVLVPRENWPVQLHSPPMLAALHAVVQAEDVAAGSEGTSLITTAESGDAMAGATRSRGPELLWVWGFASLLLLLRYAHFWVRLSRARRGWRRGHVLDEPVWISEELGPAVVGLWRARVVLPEWIMAAPRERQRMIVQHEREHVRAGDHIMLALAPLVVILFPWNAATWWQLHRFRLAVECDCDARVLRAGAGRTAYGTMLLELAATKSELKLGLTGLIEPRSLLRRRIEAMKAGQFRKSLLSVALLHGSALVALTCALVLTLPPMAPVQAQRGGRVEPNPRTGDLLYVVDGKVLGQRPGLDAVASNINVGKITVLSPDAARARYGAQGANGAVVITTRRQPSTVVRPATRQDTARAKLAPVIPPDLPRPTIVTPDRRDTVSLRVEPMREHLRSDPLIIIDGVPQPTPRPLIIINGRVYEGQQDVRSILDPATIDKVELIKGESAARLYGERGRNGVIMITTRR